MSAAHYGRVGDVGLGLDRPCGLDSTQPIYLRKLRQSSWRQLLSTAHVHETYMKEMDMKESYVCFCRNRKISDFFFCTEKQKGVRTVEEIPILVIGVTHRSIEDIHRFCQFFRTDQEQRVSVLDPLETTILNHRRKKNGFLLIIVST